ncbi:MAG: Fe-S cluster assembly protein SufD [Rhodospirillales bacterium]
MDAENTLPFSDGAPTFRDASLAQLQTRAMTRYRSAGLPDHKVEAWKYTRLPSFSDKPYRQTEETDAVGTASFSPLISDDGVAGRLVFVNGRLVTELSVTSGLPEGVRLAPLTEFDADWLAQHLNADVTGTPDGLLSLNLARCTGGFALVVERGVTLTAPIEVINIAASGDGALVWFPRNLIVLEDNTEATLIVQQTGGDAGSTFVNAVNETTLGDNARLHVYTADDSGVGATIVNRSFARLGRNAGLSTFGLYHGGGLARYEQTVLLEGEGAEARIDGGYLLRGSAHCDNTTRIEHRVPHTTCNEVFKGVVDDTARAVFQGKIVVARDAQHADGQMLNKTLLLSDKAEIDTKPELEIYADDVKCAHGATSGQIDETALFYLRSRGIPERAARNLLVRSFLGDVTERIANAAVRDAMIDRIERWLPDTIAETAEQAA